MFLVFLRLGLTSFGGPVAHLGYLREECVARRRWLTDQAYADLVALCQFLPGPASSQAVFGVGFLRSGWRGGLAAWLGFALPSMILMIGLGMGLSWLPTIPGGVLTGLKLAAVGVVAHAVQKMAEAICPDLRGKIVALAAAGIALGWGGFVGQLAALAAGGWVGWLWFHPGQPREEWVTSASPVGARVWIPLTGFLLLLLLLPVLAFRLPDLRVEAFDRLYRAGSLVLGGGHVVLPWLNSLVVGQGWVEQDLFLAGYGAAQALPGPLFTFAGFLGASMPAPMGGLTGGLLAVTAIFLPSWLLVAGTLPIWARIRTLGRMGAVMKGLNTAVVGLLLAALVHPIASSTVTTLGHLVFAGLVWLVLSFFRTPPWLVVVASAAAGWLALS